MGVADPVELKVLVVPYSAFLRASQRASLPPAAMEADP
jgi:hypothetical protein